MEKLWKIKIAESLESYVFERYESIKSSKCAKQKNTHNLYMIWFFLIPKLIKKKYNEQKNN